MLIDMSIPTGLQEPKFEPYQIEVNDYNKRLRVWKKLTESILIDYKKIYTIVYNHHKMKVRAKDLPIKVIAFDICKYRIYDDFLRLIDGKHNLYQEFREVYVNFLVEIDEIELKFLELEINMYD